MKTKGVAAISLAAFALAGCGVIKPWDENSAPSGAPMREWREGRGVSEEYDVGPRFLNGSAAIYPFTEALNGQPGAVLLRFTIGVDGKTRDIKVLSSSKPVFGGHAALAVKSWVFAPAQKNGQPVEATVEEGYCFGDWSDLRAAMARLTPAELAQLGEASMACAAKKSAS